MQAELGAGSECGRGCPLGVAGLGDIEPPLLPQIGRFGEGSFQPNDASKLAYCSTAALGLLPLYHLRLHIEGLEPQAEVRRSSEEGFARNDKRRDTKNKVRGQIVKI